MATPKQIRKSIAVLEARKAAALEHIAKHQANIDDCDAKKAELEAELNDRAAKLKAKIDEMYGATDDAAEVTEGTGEVEGEEEVEVPTDDEDAFSEEEEEGF